MSDESALITELRRVVIQIAVKSHVSAAQVGRSTPSTDEDIGGKRPPGGTSGADDWSVDSEGYWLKSADYFQEQLDKIMRNGRSPLRLRALLDEAQETLKRWTTLHIPEGQEPEYGSPQWKRYVAESSESGGSLARRFNCSREYIRQVRLDYRS